MNRRDFVRLSVSATATAALSSWLRSAIVDDPPTPAAATLRRVWDQARSTGRPLLVFVIPDEHAWDQRRDGAVLGPTLDHGSDALLADLALADFVCTTTAELAGFIPQAAALDDEFVLLVDTTTADVTVSAVDLELSGAPKVDEPFDLTRATGISLKEALAIQESQLRARFDHVEGRLRAALVETPERIAELARSNLAAVGADRWTQLAEPLRQGTPIADADLLSVAALVRVEADANPALHDDLLQTLVAAERRTFIESPPPGAHWATSTGCGTHVEGVERHSTYSCGMGHVPKLSRRFLDYYTQA